MHLAILHEPGLPGLVLLPPIDYSDVLVFATVDAVCGKDVANQTVFQHSPLENCVLTVRHIQVDIFCSGLLQSLCSMGKRTATRADIIHDENIPPGNFLRRCQLQPFNFAGTPIPMLDSEDVLCIEKIGIPLGSSFIWITQEKIFTSNSGDRFVNVLIRLHNTTIVDKGRSHIGVRVENLDAAEMKCVYEIREPLQCEYFIVVLHSVHSGVRDVRHHKQYLSVYPHGRADVVHEIPQGHILCVAVVLPSDDDIAGV